MISREFKTLNVRDLQRMIQLIADAGFQVFPNEEGLRLVSRSSGTPPAPLEEVPNNTEPPIESQEDFAAQAKISQVVKYFDPPAPYETTDWLTFHRGTKYGGWIPVILAGNVGNDPVIFTAEELIPHVSKEQDLHHYMQGVLDRKIEQEWRYEAQRLAEKITKEHLGLK